jgi:hypothetical protein
MAATCAISQQRSSNTVNRTRSIVAASLATAAALGIALALTFALFIGSAGAQPAGAEAAHNEVLHGAISMKVRGACHHHCGGGSNNLLYHGGSSDGSAGSIGVEPASKIYLVFWGSQWTNNDPSGEAGIEQSFFNGVGGSSWNNSVTQYCQGVASGTVFCNGAGTAAGDPTSVLAGVWFDNASAAPSHPTQSQLASEAVNAASHFGNTTVSANASVQYSINTATGNNSSGFGTQYCAYHSSTSSSFGDAAYTNMPYITDAGASCGANFNGLGPTAGITIVAGHEFAETDQFPSGGWLNSGGAENGDKCAWITTGN